MAAKKVRVAPNNNINNIYFTFPLFKIKKKIDYVTISLFGNIDKDFIRYKILEPNGFKSKRNIMLEEEKYAMIRKFVSLDDQVIVEIFYGSKELFYPPLQLKIHDPNKEFLNLLDSFFIYHNIHPKLSYLELTFDFYTKEAIKLMKLLETHLFMKQQRSESWRCETTFYTNDLRNSVRGMRVYYHKLDLNCVRMELTLKSQLLKRQNLTFPLSSVDSLDLSQFFQFMKLDKAWIEKHLIWRNRKQISELEKRKRKYSSLIERMIESELWGLTIEDDGRDASLMKKKERLKSEDFSLPNYSRFFVPFDELNTEFNRQVSSQSFLKSRNKDQIRGKSCLYS